MLCGVTVSGDWSYIIDFKGRTPLLKSNCNTNKCDVDKAIAYDLLLAQNTPESSISLSPPPVSAQTAAFIIVEKTDITLDLSPLPANGARL